MSNDINVTDGTVLETLNNKIDIDGGNYIGSGLEDIIEQTHISSKITNCITEIPQRIKYTLEGGTLTIKAGSVVIVPYGTEDLTSQYPKGTTFLHENFRVYDTQFADGKFFVWAELQIDISKSATDNKEDLMPLIYFDSTLNELVFIAHYVSNYASGETPPTNFKVYYNTLTNTLKSTTSSERTYSFPIMLTTGAFTSIKRVFNSMGYIGSTIWIDKGVKGLIPNGRNEDGSLKNIEYTNDKLILRTWDRTGNVVALLTPFREGDYEITDLSVSSFEADYDTIRNYINDTTFGGNLLGFGFATFYVETDFSITHFTPPQPIQLATKEEVDGFPLFKNLTLVSGFTETMEKTFDLSDYLPKDNYNYEVFVSGYGNTGTTSGNTLSISISTSLLNGNMQVFACRTRTASGVNGGGSCIVYVGADRKMTVHNAGQASSGTAFVALRGYRRMRSNFRTAP